MPNSITKLVDFLRYDTVLYCSMELETAFWIPILLVRTERGNNWSNSR